MKNGRLPAIISGKLPRINGANIGLGLGVVGLVGARSLELENPKIKEITKAYKVNLEPMNDLKDRYRQIKKNDRSKILSIKNSSMPPSNNASNAEKYAYLYAGCAAIDHEEEWMNK